MNNKCLTCYHVRESKIPTQVQDYCIGCINNPNYIDKWEPIKVHSKCLDCKYKDKKAKNLQPCNMCSDYYWYDHEWIEDITHNKECITCKHRDDMKPSEPYCTLKCICEKINWEENNNV